MGEVVDGRSLFVCQESEVEVLKPGQHHAEPEFAMTPCIPTPDRDRLDVGLPDLLGPREAAQAALHEGRTFAKSQLVECRVHRLPSPARNGSPSALRLPAVGPTSVKPGGCSPACPPRTDRRDSPSLRGNLRPPRAGIPCSPH